MSLESADGRATPARKYLKTSPRSVSSSTFIFGLFHALASFMEGRIQSNRMETRMRFSLNKWKAPIFCAALMVLSGNALFADAPAVRKIAAGEKIKIKGTILSRTGDVIMVKEKKSGDLMRVNLFEDTKIERNAAKFLFARHPRMDMTAMVPGLAIDVEGVGNADGHLDANKITFSPDDFAIVVAEEQQITANQAATRRSQYTADQGVDTANEAQASAKQAQSSAGQAQSDADQAQGAADLAQDAADRAGADAQAAAKLGLLDAAAVQMINRRVSDLDDYKTVAEESIYFGDDNAVLDQASKKALDELAKIAASLDRYMIEIAGYSSAPGSTEVNQKLSEERAAAVADYLRESGNVPFRRILAPAGYGASHHVPSDASAGDKSLDRRVDVKLLVNQGLYAAQ